MGMTAPKRGGMSETPNPHAAHLNHDSDCDRFACQFLVRSFFVGGCFNLLYNIGVR